jgi:hypothetical protein
MKKIPLSEDDVSFTKTQWKFHVITAPNGYWAIVGIPVDIVVLRYHDEVDVMVSRSIIKW